MSKARRYEATGLFLFDSDPLPSLLSCKAEAHLKDGFRFSTQAS